MQPVFKCDYCDFMGVEDKVREHELHCCDNYDRKNCFTCKHAGFANIKQLKCDRGIDIPENKIYEFCGKYERKEKTGSPIYDVFDNLFGGF